MERIAFEYRKDEPFRVVKDGCVGTIRCMEGGGVSKYIMEVKVIGDLFEDNGHGSMAGRVYDTDGQCPALGASHFQQIKYILDKKNVDEVKELGFMDNETQQIKVLTENIPCTTSRVVNGKFADVDDLSLININKTESGAVVSRYYKGIEGDHSDAVIVAMRGRNPENPSDRTVGAPTEQMLEPNSQGICNTLTSVTKDNLVMETVRIKQATKDGYIECKVGGVADFSFPDSTTRRGRVQDGGDVCPTLMAGEQDICRIEKADNGVLEYKAIDEQNMCVRDETFGTLTTDGSSPKHNNRVMECVETQYRIRKLTPRECYRLMAVPEKDIDKMLEVNSNTQCYKQAGNSIVVNCLIAIFSQMGIQGIPRWNEGLSEKYK